MFGFDIGTAFTGVSVKQWLIIGATLSLLTVGGIAWYKWEHMKSEVASAHTTIAVQGLQIDRGNLVIKQQDHDIGVQKDIHKAIEHQKDKSAQEIIDFSKKLDIQTKGVTNTDNIEAIVNLTSSEMIRCLEIATGSPVSDADSLNSSCKSQVTK